MIKWNKWYIGALVGTIVTGVLKLIGDIKSEQDSITDRLEEKEEAQE